LLLLFARFSTLVLTLGILGVISGCGGGSSSATSGGSGGNTSPIPAVKSISPSRVPAGSSALTLTVSGSGFVSTSVVEIGGIPESTTYVSGTQLTVTVPTDQLASGAEISVVVSNGSSNSGSSTAMSLEVDNPAPTITSVSPMSELIGAPSAVITVTGTGFVPATIVNVNGLPQTTTFTSSTQISVPVTVADVAVGGSLSLTAVNPAPGGGTSAAVSLPVNNPAVAIIHLSPSVLNVGSTMPATVTVIGNTFVPASVVQVNGSARATTYVNATTLTFIATVADQAIAGTLPVTVTNPAPGGGTSAAISLPVTNPAVGTISLSPSTLTAATATPTTITVTGNTFVPTSVVQVNGIARATAYVNATTLTFIATVADQATTGTLAVTVTNPAPGGGTSPSANLSIAPPASTPVITSVSPTSIITGSPDTVMTVIGTGFTANSVVQWNGTTLATTLSYGYGGSTLFATVPAADLTTAGTATVTVNTPNANSPLSNSLVVNITNPPVPSLTYLSPNAGPVNLSAAVTLIGTGFTGTSTVALNGVTIPSTYVNSTEINATFPASGLAIPGNVSVTVTTPAPGGGTSSPQVYTTYILIPNNDIAYNPADGLLYASVPTEAVGALGNCVVGIDPLTGTMMRQIWVGTNPNKLAISTDGTQLFVGLDGAGAVAQVNLTQGKVVNQFSLGGGPGVYDAPYLAQYLAAVPGSPNSVAVAIQGSFSSGTGVTIFDSGVPRTTNSSTSGEGPLSFGSSASNLYVAGSTVQDLTVSSTGITAETTIYSSSGAVSALQYDNGRLYLSTGAVVNTSTGLLLGTFYSSASTPASGPVVSDSTLGSAFVGVSSFSNSGQVFAFDESSFNLTGSIPVNGVGTQGYPTSFRKIVRWGQNGIALSTIPSAFSSTNQIYIFQSPLVKNLSSSPADVSVSLAAPATATTGTAISWVATVSNSGPNSAAGATLAMNLDSSLIIDSITASQGSCGNGAAFTCDLGSLASGASATVTVSATPTNSGTLAGTADASSTSYDPNFTNNQSTSSTTVTGGIYGAVPAISAISPNLVQADSSNFTLTVTGTGFNTASTVNLGTTALATSYVSATTLTATVTTSEIANYGWAPVTVSNPTPGGGVSPIVPLTIYNIVNVPASAILFDPYSQLLYATIPSTATNLTGNSVVTVNPVTGAVGTPVAVGSQPTVMAETGDGNYLYISLSGANSLAQYDLLHQTLVQTVPLSGASGHVGSNAAATALAVMPGTESTLAVDFSGSDGILDINGSTGTFRPNFGGYNFPTFGDASHLYTYDNGSTGAEFYRYGINANGMTLIDGTTLDGMGGFSGGFQLANGLIHGSGGGIANPSTTPPSQIATLPLFDFYGSGDTAPGVGNAPDSSLQKEFLMLENTAGTWAYGLVRYDLTTYLPEAVLGMPASASGVSSNWTMLRWGQDGLALLSYDNFGVNPPAVVMMLLRGPFVTPQELGTNSAASLTSSSATTITHGSGNTMLTLTGSNFLPGVAVTWNGSYRTTTIVDATHVAVAIPASDLASTGTVTLVATNPGTSTSNALQITID
jgi:trimeric autotransporter adhesin